MGRNVKCKASFWGRFDFLYRNKEKRIAYFAKYLNCNLKKMIESGQVYYEIKKFNIGLKKEGKNLNKQNFALYFRQLGFLREEHNSTGKPKNASYLISN